jgi:Zinc carboxypeptidase
MRTMKLAGRAQRGPLRRMGWTAAMLWGCVGPPPATAQALAAVPAASAPAAASAVESPGVAARFPDPAVTYRTPAFEPGRSAFTGNAELRGLLRGLVRDAQGSADPTSVRLLQLGSSQSGVPLEALHFSREPVALAATGVLARAPRPVVLLVGQQHGDEPAGSEALIVVAQALAGAPPGTPTPLGQLAAVLDRIDVVILPRANPDGAAVSKRVTASGIDANRDHLLLRTPEAQAQAQLAREFNPVVVVDAHEYTALGRYVQKFGAVQRFDALIQYAMVANLPEFITRASEEWFRRPMVEALRTQGLSSEWYYTTSTDLANRKLSMGGVQPDTGRNVHGLRNTVSILVETRGVDLGSDHLLRRVHTHVTAITSVLRSAAGRADDLQKLRRFVDQDVAAVACRGEVVVEAAATPSEYTLLMLDPRTGADKPVNVAWDSALALVSVKRRARPCGYWLAADQVDAVLRLRGLGVQVQQLEETGALRGEAYRETARELGVRTDARGTIADAGGIVRVGVELVAAVIDAKAGSYYVGLDQPLANLVVAAMEPDTQNSYVANRVVTHLNLQARVLARPDLRMSALP